MINKTETPTTTKSNIIKEKKQKKKDKRAKDTPKAADDDTVKIENTPKAEDENAIQIGEVSEPPSERNVSQCNKKYTTRYNHNFHRIISINISSYDLIKVFTFLGDFGL